MSLSEKIKSAVEEHQCPGCMVGGDTSCYEKSNFGSGCGRHAPGTAIFPSPGFIFLGMPTGFNRIGKAETKITIHEKYDHDNVRFDMWNIPVWKHLTKEGYTLVRGIRPRINDPFLYIILEDCMDKIDCLEITNDHIENMD